MGEERGKRVRGKSSEKEKIYHRGRNTESTEKREG
jgi:hypothetical protein